MNIKKFNPSLLVALLCTILLSSCLKDKDNYVQPPIAGLAMINGYVEEPGVFYKIYRNGFNDALFRLDYKSYLNNNVLYAGKRNLTIYSGLNNAKIIDTIYDFKDSTNYSGFIYGKPNNAKFIITRDNEIANLGNNAAVRFFHLANQIDQVSISFNSETTATFTRAAQQDTTTLATNQVFISKASGTTTLIAKNGNGNEIAKRENIQLKPERYYSIILIGDAESTTLPLYIGIIEY